MPSTVTNDRELAAGLRSFWEGAERSNPEHEAFLSLLKRGRNFICNADKTRMAPSRFVGYLGNSLAAHTKHAGVDGGVTDAAITRILGQRVSDESLELAYRQICTSFRIVPSQGRRSYWLLPRSSSLAPVDMPESSGNENVSKDAALPASTFKRVTIFESGYVHGFRQAEVQSIRFHVATPARGREYPAATFVRRGRRQHETISAVRIVAIAGWDLPQLETDRVVSSGGDVVRTAKFPASAALEWSSLLDDYLSELGPKLVLLFDGRALPRAAARTLMPHPIAGPGQDVLAAVESVGPDVRPTDREFREGHVVQAIADRFERDPDARRACLEHYGYACQICDILMSEVYGSLGDGFIHVHHRTPLSEIRETYVVDPIRDLIPVCPNCHSMLHRGPATLGVEDLAEIMRNR